MSKDKSTGKKLADMMYGNPEGAAFGIYPKAGKRSEDKQDREAAKNFPVDLARGVVAGAVGMPGDIESLIRMLPGLNEKTVLPTSEDVLKRIPFGSDSPTGRFASGLGTLIGGSAPVGPAVQGVKAGARGALSAARAGERMAERVVPQIMERGGAGADVLSGLAQGSRSNVIKPKGGNWLGGNLMGNIDENVRRLKPYTKAGAQPDFLQKELKSYEAALERLKNDKYTSPQMVQAQQDVVDNIKKKIAVNNWVESNLGKYVKNQMGTPEDPVRLMFDKRTKESEAKFAKDMERAKRVEDRAIDEPDPRRQANFLREAERLRNEAATERNFAMEHITHVPGRMEDYSPDADQYLKQRRADAGFPAEGMGESEMAKRWETLTDDAIVSMRAGDVQEMKSILAQAQDAERAVKTLEPEIQRRFEERIRAAGLNESEVASVMRSTPMMDKAAIIGDVEYQNLNKLYNDLSASLHRDEFAAGQQNPFIEKLDPETLLYSGNTADMGFDHVIDVLKQDVMEGRIRPEQLSKVSIEDAVRRTAEYDQEMAIKMRETAIKQQEGFPLYKEYPEGYRWIELKKPEDLPEGYSLDDMGNVVDEKGHLTNHPGEKRLEEALKYEGDTMGHCVGGYCPDVLEGRSRIYSLRDARGEPHVTVETEPREVRTWDDVTAAVGPEEAQKLWKEFDGMGGYNMDNTDAAFDMFVKQKGIQVPERIVQIKGKKNEAPVEKYLPFVQDFVKSGQWSDVGDLQNTGLFKLNDEYMTEAEAAAKYKPMTQEALNFLETHPAFEQHRVADEAYSRFKGDPFAPEYREVERAAGAPVSPSVPYTYRELRALLSSPEDWTDRNGTIYEPISRALEKLNQAKKELGIDLPPEDGMARGGPVHFSDNPDVMALELAAGGAVRMQVGGIPKRVIDAGAKAIKALKPAKVEKEPAVPLTLPRVRPTTKDIMEAAERVGKQQAGEFVRSPLLKDTTNLAGRSKREFDRLKKLDYKVTPIKDLPEMKPYEAKIGEVNIALPGDQTISDMLVESVDDMPIGVISEGGANFGRGRLSDPEETRAFWASNIGPAGSFQRKVTELARLYDTDMVTAYHLAMGQTSNNFAQHLAEANMKAIDYSKLDKSKMNRFDSEIAAGTFKTDKKTGERIYTTFPEWPGIANPEEALEAMKKDPELRKWFNDRMKTLKSTKPSDLPNAKSIEYAMTEPDIRDLEINMTGLSAGRMKPGAELIPDSAHQTYSHDIPGTALGRAPELSPFSISFPDATAFVRENYRAPDFTGTIQKVFPHQVVDEAYLEDMYKYYTQLRKVRGFNEGGEVKNQNNEQHVQNPVHFTESPDAMRLALTKRN
jgi:hypothetical protein